MTALALIPNATALEAAADAVGAARYPIAAERIASPFDPATCPLAMLPFLAWSLSVDLWDDAWPELKKREACRKALQLHRLKTTVAGIRAHLELVDAELVKVTRPPARGFLRGAMTDAQRAAWLESLPQVRIYPFLHRGAEPSRRSFSAGPGAHGRFHGARPPHVDVLTIGAGAPLSGSTSEARTTTAPLAVRSFLCASRGPAMLGRRATFYDLGEEVDVTLTAVDGALADQVYIRRRAPSRMFHGAGFGRGWLRATEAARQLVTIRAAGLHDFAVERGAEPVDVRPRRVAQGRTAPAPRAFMGRHFGPTFLKASYAPHLLYDRIALNDPQRLGARRKVLSWHGRGRFGIAPFTAELKIAVPMSRGVRRSGRWHGTGFRKSADMAPLAAAVRAIGVSKALRDTILIDTTTHARAEFGAGLRFGDFDFGQIREAA